MKYQNKYCGGVSAERYRMLVRREMREDKKYTRYIPDSSRRLTKSLRAFATSIYTASPENLTDRIPKKKQKIPTTRE